ncbi:heavy-metal-associated domain-containing protein [Clostridium sp. AM58-1XD]|uniref:heavy-metal-associated domain-containing protein n=1 Tax=Clostridium sp. AM58-1XD TaxID=2292307 RepID=UPI000E47BFF0|nr:heavy-metal-associated domain-containing protein [Clostridium sp. AM58-1XD]RGY96472.1 cation transporter [Clostridium sp. AM58-1XD]
MKKIVKLDGLCCGNCAAKIEEGIKKIDGVTSASLSFMTQRLVMEIVDGEEERVLEEARRIKEKIEPEAEFRIIR